MKVSQMKIKASNTTSRQPNGIGACPNKMDHLKKWFLCASLFGVLAGCPAQGEDVLPPTDQMIFPTDLAFDFQNQTLFVINSNANRLFSSGSMQAFDYPSVVTAAKAWRDSSAMPQDINCETDVDSPEVLVCDESSFVLSETTTRLGNFASTLAIQPLDDGRTRIFSTVRGDPSLTWIDWNPLTKLLECKGSDNVCDSEHRLSSLRNDSSYGFLPPEPFGLYVDNVNETIAITDLGVGTVSLADAPKNGDEPILTDTLGGFFSLGNLSTIGAFGVKGQFLSSEHSKLYVTSVNENRLQTFTVTRHGGRPSLVPSDFFFLGGDADFTESRGLAFNEAGTRLAVINRTPPLVHILDTSMNEQGVPRHDAKGLIEICSQSSEILIHESQGRTTGFINCFALNQIWVLDLDAYEVLSFIDVGFGPFAMALDQNEGLLMVANYLENSISVIDIDPTRTTTYRPLFKLGFRNDEDNL